MSDNTTWLMSLRAFIMGQKSLKDQDLLLDYQRYNLQLVDDIAKLHNVIKGHKHYADILSATIDLLRAKIDVLEANNIKPLNRSKRK
jgi:hypothetical protein